MNWLRTLACSFIVILPPLVCAADVPDQGRYEKVFSDIIAKINDGLKARQIAYLVPVPKRGIIASNDDPFRKQQIVTVSFNPQINVQIVPKSFEVVSFYRDVSAAGLGSYDTPPKPKWTPDQAIKEARAWYENVLGKFPGNAGSPIAEYDPGLNPPKYYDGQWAVRWPRDDGHGHQFSQDTISVTLNEKYGITSLANNFTSKFPHDQKILISKDQAIAVGRSVAQKLLSSPLTADWSKGLSLLPAATAQLWVVNPNHILRYNSLEELASAPFDSTARLAWVVTYRASNGSMGRDVEVWIDAETKEAIGGDFK
jgi:hypothetical protein